MEERRLVKETEVKASPQKVWEAWSTEEGAETFFAPEARIELRPSGAYELYFDSSQPAGLRGSEGCKILALEEGRRLVFSWNFPPSLPGIRNERTRVEVLLHPLGPYHTRVTLTQTGWREGEDWERGYEYFDRAWGGVLQRLSLRFA